MGKPRVSPEVRAAALAALHAGEQPAEVAERYGIDGATVRVWKNRYVTGDSADHVTDAAPAVTDAVTAVTPQQPKSRSAIEQQQLRIGALILDLLEAKLKASQAIAETALNAEWRSRYSPAELAELGQWLDSTAFAIGDRLAGAASRHAHDDRADPDPTPRSGGVD